MNLSSPRLHLTEITQEDIPLIHSLHCDPLVERYNTIGIPPHFEVTAAQLEPVMADQKNKVRNLYGWAIRLKADDQFIGEAGMSVTNNRFQSAEIHYHIIPELWGKGFATEVAKAQIRFAFEELRLHRVQAGAATANTGSHRVLEKAGMQREGLKRKVLPIRGAWYDNYMYAILDTDPRP
jgi:RimJ/RimL family protein N-acetyltransferase